MVLLSADNHHRACRIRKNILLSAFFFCLMTQVAPADEQPDPGRAIYNFRCYFCHGYAGDARTLAARFLHPPPRAFTGLSPGEVSREAMIETVANGRPRTAMKSFAGVLAPDEIAAVVDFIRTEFMRKAAANTRYHTGANGWPNHGRYAMAFPFATGELPLDTPWKNLDENQRAGWRLFFTACISCHDRSRVVDERVLWERQALSYPRFGFKPGDAQRPPDAVSGATPFARHDIPVRIAGLTPQEREGESLFLGNCAFCHGADGTGKNWIGRFLEPHPRDLTDPAAMAGKTPTHLHRVIRDGLPGTSMPAWGSVLDQGQIEAVVAYISRAFHPAEAETPRSDARPPAAAPRP